MKIEYSKRALTDLRKVAAESLVFGLAVSTAVEVRIRQVIVQIGEYPESAPQVDERPGVHVVPLVRYPYKIFYRVLTDRVRILISATRRAGHGRGIASPNALASTVVCARR